jgi:hypothetical protein
MSDARSCASVADLNMRVIIDPELKKLQPSLETAGNQINNLKC